MIDELQKEKHKGLNKLALDRLISNMFGAKDKY